METSEKRGLTRLVLVVGTVWGAMAASAASAQETIGGDVAANDPALYFHAADKSVMMCLTPPLAAAANLISRDPQRAGGQGRDAGWLKTHIDNKDCAPLQPGQRFIASVATPVYAGPEGAIWVASVFSPETPAAPPIGFVPLDRIVFIAPQKD